MKCGGWSDDSAPLDVGFSQVADALGDGAPLESATPETLLAVAFAAGDSARLLKITPIEIVSEWESAIDDRGGYEDVGLSACCRPTTRISPRRRPRTPRRSGELSMSSSPRTAS